MVASFMHRGLKSLYDGRTARRVTFRFEDGYAVDVDYVDDH
jgi:hypothetical protein